MAMWHWQHSHVFSYIISSTEKQTTHAVGSVHYIGHAFTYWGRFGRCGPSKVGRLIRWTELAVKHRPSATVWLAIGRWALQNCVIVNLTAISLRYEVQSRLVAHAHNTTVNWFGRESSYTPNTSRDYRSVLFFITITIYKYLFTIVRTQSYGSRQQSKIYYYWWQLVMIEGQSVITYYTIRNHEQHMQAATKNMICEHVVRDWL